MIDELEAKGCANAAAHPTDRRAHALHITDAGRRNAQLRAPTPAGGAQNELLAPLDDAERAQLHDLLLRPWLSQPARSTTRSTCGLATAAGGRRLTSVTPGAGRMPAGGSRGEHQADPQQGPRWSGPPGSRRRGACGTRAPRRPRRSPSAPDHRATAGRQAYDRGDDERQVDELANQPLLGGDRDGDGVRRRQGGRGVPVVGAVLGGERPRAVSTPDGRRTATGRRFDQPATPAGGAVEPLIEAEGPWRHRHGQARPGRSTTTATTRARPGFQRSAASTARPTSSAPRLERLSVRTRQAHSTARTTLTTACRRWGKS